jgi:hypothetical protein
MKVTTIIALGTLLGTSAFVAAQDTPAPQGRTPRAPRPPTAEQIKEFDKDGDGKLNEAETKAMREARMAEMKKMQEAMLAKYDENKNGKLDPEEAAKARADRQKEQLEKYDTDKDGKLSDEERAKMPPNERRMGPGGPGGRTGGRRGAPPAGAPPADKPADKPAE